VRERESASIPQPTLAAKLMHCQLLSLATCLFVLPSGALYVHGPEINVHRQTATLKGGVSIVLCLVRRDDELLKQAFPAAF
jgi:hypothetical protein